MFVVFELRTAIGIANILYYTNHQESHINLSDFCYLLSRNGTK